MSKKYWYDCKQFVLFIKYDRPDPIVQVPLLYIWLKKSINYILLLMKYYYITTCKHNASDYTSFI